MRAARVRFWHSFTVPACAQGVSVAEGRPAVAMGADLAANFVRDDPIRNSQSRCNKYPSALCEII